MEKHFQQQNSNLNIPFNKKLGSLVLTAMCLIAIGSGITVIALKNYHTKIYWQKNYQNYCNEKQALELCFHTFNKLREIATKDTIITYENKGCVYFINALTKENLGCLNETFFENSTHILISTDPDNLQYIACTSQKEGLRQTLETFFQQQTFSEITKPNYSLVQQRWNSLKNNSTLNPEFFEPYLKSWSKTDTTITLTLLNPFDRSLNGTYNLATENNNKSGTTASQHQLDCQLKGGQSCQQTIQRTCSNSITLKYNNVSKTLNFNTTHQTSTNASPWRKPNQAIITSQNQAQSIEDKIYFKTQTSLQRLNTCLFSHNSLNPTISFGINDTINQFFWNNIIFDEDTIFFNLNANKNKLKTLLTSLFIELESEQTIIEIYNDILKRQPFYDIHSFTSNLSPTLAKYWNKLPKPPIFVVREESFIIESQLKKSSKNTSIRCRLWVHRQATSEHNRTWTIKCINFKRF